MAQKNALQNHMQGNGQKAGNEVATQEDHKSLAHLLTDPKIKQQMALALPKHMTADRLARIALTELRKTPKLAQCDQTSFLGAIMQLAALGLEPGGALGHAYLIPFDKNTKVGNSWTKRTEVQLVIGYRGMLDLVRRSGQIVSLEARAVYEADHFEVELGLDSKIVHRPNWTAADRGQLTFVYAVAKLKDGGVQFDVMSRAEIERIRDASQGYTAALASAEKYNKEASSPWIDHFEPMALKTVIRRLFKYLPVSIEIQRAVGLDEMAEAGINQGNAFVIDADFQRLPQQQEPPAVGEGDSPRVQTGPDITAQDIRDALEAAKDRDQLDAAADLVNLLPEPERKPLLELWNERCQQVAA